MHLTVVVWEQPVLHVPQWEGVEQQDVGDGDRPHQAETHSETLEGESGTDIVLLERYDTNIATISRKM